MITARVSPQQYEALREQLAAEGCLISGNAGVVNEDGVRAEIRYDGTAVLQVNVTHTPFVVTKAFAEGKIADGLRAKGVPCAVAG